MTAPASPPPPRHPPWLLLAAALLLPLAFALYTNHVWEDFFITFRTSRNLVAGHGLVYQPGERVCAFTSPLGTLLPAACAALAGAGHDQAALWLFRLVSAALLAATAAILWRLAERLRLAALGAALLFGLLLFDGKITDFSMNGMETALVLVAFAWTVLAQADGPAAPWRLGLGLGGLMWGRPDGFIPAGVVLAGFALFAWRTDGRVDWRAVGRWLARSALVGAALYLPWFLWAWWYYGSPVPNTIIAKAAVDTPAQQLALLLSYPTTLLTGQAHIARIFMPAYYYLGGWPIGLFPFSLLLTLPAAFYFLVPRAHPVGRALSLALLLGGGYLQIAPPNPWYAQVWQLLAILVMAVVVSDLTRLFAWLQAAHGAARRHSAALRVAVGILIGVQAALWACTAVQMRINQREIEDGIRRPIGLWLRAHARPDDRVMLEPLGYIGYFSGLKMLDNPGLCAPEVTAAIRSGARTWPELITRLQPAWLVLRASEIRDIGTRSPDLLSVTYRAVEVFDARNRLSGYRFFPGSGYAAFDSVFVVYQRAAASAAPP
ncbi:MAG TPA: hypothetical protein VMF63_14790 [Opitutaceae bacterium]|nr:hypothetical protein [Opitutaceae bacterium]